MKKILTKTITVLLISAFMLTFFSACGGAQNNEVVPEFPTELGDGLDFDGKEFIFRDVVHHGDTPLIPTSMENALDDLLLEHYEKTEKKDQLQDHSSCRRRLHHPVHCFGHEICRSDEQPVRKYFFIL